MTERLSDKNPCKLCNENYLCGECRRYSEWRGDAINKLAEYETAEEEGRLVVLPCKVGQCVYTNHSMIGWYMRKSERPYLRRVVFIGLNAEEPFFNIILGEGKMLQYKFDDIGKTVFLTREEAERALREMEEKS